MTSQPTPAIVRGGRIDTVSAGGRRSYVRVRGLLHYVTYGRYADQLGREPQPRGRWLDQAGRPHDYEAVRQWAKAMVHHQKYDHAYQLLLSTRDGGLTAEAFNRTLQQGSSVSEVSEWRFMVHDDTGHQHAHAVLFSHEKLSPARYREWQQTTQAALGEMQIEPRAALVEQADLSPPVEPAAESSAGDALTLDRDRGWELDYV